MTREKNIGRAADTPDGRGTVTGIDLPLSKHWRYVVKLYKRKYNFDPAYFPGDVKFVVQELGDCLAQW